jgi:hypothetical protein
VLALFKLRALSANVRDNRQDYRLGGWQDQLPSKALKNFAP